MRNARSIFTQSIACFRRGERGVQLVEVAIVIPILLILMAATAEFGRYFYYYSTLSAATRTAVRHISSKPFIDSSAPNDFKTQARNLAVCGSTTTCAANSEILPGLTTANFEITPVTGNFPETVTVTVVNYNYQPIFNLGSFVSGVSWTSVPVTASTTMRYLLTN